MFVSAEVDLVVAIYPIVLNVPFQHVFFVPAPVLSVREILLPVCVIYSVVGEILGEGYHLYVEG